MRRSCDSPDGILLDKSQNLDINETKDHSFFLALKERTNEFRDSGDGLFRLSAPCRLRLSIYGRVGLPAW